MRVGVWVRGCQRFTRFGVFSLMWLKMDPVESLMTIVTLKGLPLLALRWGGMPRQCRDCGL